MCASAVPSPHSHRPAHTDGSVFNQCIHTPCPVRRSSYARAAEADMRHVRAEACVRARARVCAWARPHPRRRVRALPAAAERRINRLAGVLRGVGLQREHRQVEHRASHDDVRRMRRSGPARTAADCARSVVDACAAVARGGAADVSARARAHAYVAMRIRAYVDGSPIDTHVCSSAIELPLPPSLSNVRRTHA
jgi:hypothetical protein